MAAQELRWLTYLLTDLGERPSSPPVLYVDNKAAIALCQEHRLEHRTKHIALRYFLARELQQRGQLCLRYVATRANTADIFTKALQPGDHQRFCTVLGLVPTVSHLLLCGDVVIHPELALPFLTGLLNLWPRVSLPETSPTLLWTGEVGDASRFRVWGSRAFVRDSSADKLSSRAVPRVFLGIVPDAPGWQFYHATSRRVLPSQDVTFDESVPYYRLFPYRTAPLPPPPLFLAPGAAVVDPLPPQGAAPSGVSQVDPVEPVEVAVDSRPAVGAEPGGAEPGGEEPGGAEPGGAEPGGAEPGSTEPGGAEPQSPESRGFESGGPEPEGPAPGGALSSKQPREWYFQYCSLRRGTSGARRETGTGASASPPSRELPSRERIREWYERRCTLRSGAPGVADPAAAGGATGAGDSTGSAGAAAPAVGAVSGAVDPGVGATASAADPSAGAAAGAEDPGVGAAASTADPGVGAAAGAEDPGAGAAAGAVESGVGAAAGAEDPGAGVSAGSRVAARQRPYFVPLLQQVLGLPPSLSPPPPLECSQPVQSRLQLQPASTLPAPSPYTGPTGGLAERREPASRPVSPVRTARTSGCGSRQRPPPVPGTHRMSLCPSTAPLRAPLPSPPESSLPALPDPESDSLRAASPTVTRLLATVVTDPSFESIAASALVAELVDFAARSRLDYAASLVAESESVCPPSVGAMDAEMASWKSTGTYIDAVPPPGANIVSGMWIFRVKRPPGSPPVFQARYVARGFSQRQGVDYFQTFSPTPKMTTLRVLLHVAAHRDYELHSLDFSTAFLQGSLHEEIWLRRPLGFTGSFPPGTQWSLRRPVYGLRQAPGEWHDTLRTTLAALGFAPSTADPSLFLRTDTSLLPFYILVYVDDLVFATADTAGLAHVKSELQKRHTCTDLGELRSYLGLQITRDRARRTITLTQSHMVQQVLQRFGFTYSSPQATPLPTRHSLSALPSDESVESSGPYPELVGCLMYLMTCTRPDLAYLLSILARYVAPGRHRPEHMAAAKRVLRYLCSTSGMGLVLGGRSPVVLTGHADASWADDQATQRSSQGYTFSLGSSSVSWRATRLSSVHGSSCEAEIYAGAMAAQELRWLTYLLTDLGEQPRSPPVLYVDNKAMLALCREQRLEHRTKHIALCYFLARELQQRGQMRLVYVASEANTADVFTKALAPCDHQRFCTQLEDRDPTGGFRGDRHFASAADEADWDEQNVDNASEEAGPLPYCSVLIPMDDENPRESVNAETYFDLADTGYVTPAEVNTNEAERIGPNFIPDPETGDEAAYPADTTLPRYTQSGLQILGLVTAVHGTETPKEPATVQQALGGEHREKWREAMDKELEALKERNTWKVVPIGVARNKTILTGKWVFRVKTKADSTIDKFKARWVVRGFDQEHGRDFTETFASEGESTIYLNAAKYADTIAKRFALTPTTISTPYRYTAGSHKEESAPLKPVSIRNYQRKLGCLLFAAVTCRPDLSYSASQLATYLKRPEAEHMAELDRALHYLDEIEKGRLELSYCPTSEMAANYLTKKLGKSKFEYCMLLTGQSHVTSNNTPEAKGSVGNN
ncbi:unnamed protein product [Closterium sp. NIES-54]